MVMPNPWMIVGGLVIVIGAYFYGHSNGTDSVLAKWNAEKAEMNVQALAELEAAHARAAAIEKEMSGRLQVATSKYMKAIKGKKDAEAAAVGRAADGGLFIDARCEGGADAVSGAAPGAGGSNGAQRVELSRASGEFLVRLAAEADRVTEQLTACQNILIEERNK